MISDSDWPPAAEIAAKIQAERAYEQSGMYPKQTKPFRIWALLGCLSVTMLLLAVSAALINWFVMG
jgi:hypothetical protein